MGQAGRARRAPLYIIYILYTVPPSPPSTILHLYTTNYRAGGRGLPPLPLVATHSHTFSLFYILYTVNYPVRGARDCAPYHWMVRPLSFLYSEIASFLYILRDCFPPPNIPPSCG